MFLLVTIVALMAGCAVSRTTAPDGTVTHSLHFMQPQMDQWMASETKTGGLGIRVKPTGPQGPVSFDLGLFVYWTRYIPVISGDQRLAPFVSDGNVKAFGFEAEMTTDVGEYEATAPEVPDGNP